MMPGAVRVATKWLISLYGRPNLKHHYITSTKQKDRQFIIIIIIIIIFKLIVRSLT